MAWNRQKQGSAARKGDGYRSLSGSSCGGQMARGKVNGSNEIIKTIGVS